MLEKKINSILKKMNDIDNYAFSINKERLEKNDLKSLDSSHRQLDFLSAIIFEGVNTGSQLAKTMQLNKSTVSLILSKMEKKSLIVRVYGEAKDNRLTYIKSTEKGKQLLVDFFYCRLKNFKMFYDYLTQERRECFLKGVAYLRAMIGDITPYNDKLLMFIFNNYKDKFEDFNDELLMLSKDLVYFMSVFFNTEGSFREKLNEIKAKSELTVTQIRIMCVILKCNITSITELEKELKTSVSALSICISRLEAKGYIEKQQLTGKGDARRKYLKITPLGMEVLDNEQAKYREIRYNFIKNLSDEQLDIFDKALDYIVMALKDL